MTCVQVTDDILCGQPCSSIMHSGPKTTRTWPLPLIIFPPLQALAKASQFHQRQRAQRQCAHSEPAQTAVVHGGKLVRE